MMAPLLDLRLYYAQGKIPFHSIVQRAVQTQACLATSASLLIFIVFLSSILPFSPLNPNRSRQMSAHFWVWFCLRFLPVKREFFLTTVAHVGMLGLFKVKTWRVRFRTCSMWKVPWDNFVVCYQLTIIEYHHGFTLGLSVHVGCFQVVFIMVCQTAGHYGLDVSPQSVLWIEVWKANYFPWHRMIYFCTFLYMFDCS